MKIAVISYHTCPYEPFGRGYSGGMNVFLRELIERLSFMGVSVDVFTRSVDDDYVSVKNEHLKVYHVGCRLPPSPSLADFLAAGGRFSEGVLGCLGEGTDLAFSNYWLSAPVSLAVKARMGIPVVHMNHTLEKVKEKFSKTAYPSDALRQARLFWEFFAQKFADRVIFPSRRDFEVSGALYPFLGKKGVVVYPGISEEFLDSPCRRVEARGEIGVPEDVFLFLFSGRDERTKNAEGLIAAFKELDRKRCRLLVLGGGAYPGEGIQCLPAQARESLAATMDASDCIVVPSFYESFGFFAMEALARGKPVVVPAGTFIGDLTADYDLGEVFDPGQRGSLARALGSCVERKDRFRERAPEIAARAGQFTWERSSSRFLQVLDQLS
ncbi:MAG: glycosyltransferase [Deltaproteobacteria bacterium]|nr:glycosyltransferase [Deltaproteobacteria bacterium]NIS76488.1 glycosyltransferase [Deltaproteobacteria bacterium]